MTGHEKVDQLASLHLQGNIIPHTWFQNILMPSGKVDLNSIIILSEIVYWYRPTVTKSEETGHVTAYKKRFKSDMLQRSYDSFATQFGLSKRQVTDAIKRLEDLGLIQRYFRNMVVGGTHMSNVLHIDINADAVIALTNNREYTPSNVSDNENSGEGVTFKSDRSHVESGGGITNKRETSHAPGGDVYRDYYRDYTENTQRDNDVVNVADESKNESQSETNPIQFYEQNGFGILSPYVGQKIGYWIDETNPELVMHALKIAVENNVLKWNYTEKILKDWQQRKLLTVDQVTAAERQRQMQQAHRKPFGKAQREEQLPEWFGQDEQETKAEQSDAEVERLRQQLLNDFNKRKAEEEE